MIDNERIEVLVVDDDPAIRRELRNVLEDERMIVREAADGEQALRNLEGAAPNVILLDIRMPGPDGLQMLPRLRDAAPGAAVLMVSGETTLDNAFHAGQLGAYDFLPKPVDPERLIAAVMECSRVSRLRRSTPAAADRAPADTALERLVGKSPALQSLAEQIRRIAPSQGRVLITGENGAGKELVAEAIHALSKRSLGPLVKLNCAAIPKDLVESELFGHEKGAFTGAVQSRKGRMELADGGTLFLDEIGDLSLDAQAKLLRAIETGEVERVGATRTSRSDVRVLAATNKDLAAAVEAGDFRQDLFYRLNVLPIVVPPLRERRTDVPILAEHFLGHFCAVEGKRAKTLDEGALEALLGYSWPGNVRELRNLMERAAILVEGDTISAVDLEPWLIDEAGDSDGVGLKGEIGRRESDAIRRALESANWNVTQAAAGLGIDRTNLHRKMRKYGIRRH
jgi:two-component system nitrogen regulation response regulator NtrX